MFSCRLSVQLYVLSLFENKDDDDDDYKRQMQSTKLRIIGVRWNLASSLRRLAVGLLVSLDAWTSMSC